MVYACVLSLFIHNDKTFGFKILHNSRLVKLIISFSTGVFLTVKKCLFSPFFCVSLSSCTDQVLEKAMHKCVLKPLKSVIEVALHDFQVRIFYYGLRGYLSDVEIVRLWRFKRNRRKNMICASEKAITALSFNKHDNVSSKIFLA